MLSLVFLANKIMRMHVLARFDVAHGKTYNLAVLSHGFPIHNRLKRNLMTSRNGHCSRHRASATHQFGACLDGFLEHTHVVVLAQKQHYGIQFNYRHRREGSGLAQLRTAESYNSTT